MPKKLCFVVVAVIVFVCVLVAVLSTETDLMVDWLVDWSVTRPVGGLVEHLFHAFMCLCVLESLIENLDIC